MLAASCGSEMSRSLLVNSCRLIPVIQSLSALAFRLQNSRFWTFSEGAKRRKRDPRV